MNRMLLSVVAMVGLAACSHMPRQSDADRAALYASHAGEPVRNFRFFGRLSGWTPLGDSALAVWTRPGEAWLLDLSGPCPDLGYATAISVTSHMSQVSARFDDVIPLGAGTSAVQIPCRIVQIRPVDTKALKLAEQQLREAATEQRQDPAQEPLR